MRTRSATWPKITPRPTLWRVLLAAEKFTCGSHIVDVLVQQPKKKQRLYTRKKITHKKESRKSK